MSTLRSSEATSLVASHWAMGVVGMLAGWLFTASPPMLALCTTRPFADRLLPVLSLHVQAHLPMFVGMALANVASILFAAWLQRSEATWQQEIGRGTGCFVIMSIGMLLGCVALGDRAIALPGAWVSFAPLGAMLAGTLFACMAVQPCRQGIAMARAAAHDAHARPAYGVLAR